MWWGGSGLRLLRSLHPGCSRAVPPRLRLFCPKSRISHAGPQCPRSSPPISSRPGAVVGIFLPVLPAQGCRVAAAGRGWEQLQGEVDEAKRAACNVAPGDRASPRPRAAVSRSRAMPPRLSRAKREFTAASAAPCRVHLPLVSAAPVVVTLGNCSCIDLKKPMHRGIWLIFLWFLLLSSMKLLLR